MARRGKLTEEQKAFVVQRLAIDDTPDEAAKAVKAEFGIEVTRQACEAYNPYAVAGRGLAKQRRELFDKTRDRFHKKLDGIPDAHKAVRVKRLSRMSIAAEQRGNFVLAASLLEQIAKEVGRVYTNRHELTGKERAPLPATPAVVILPAKEAPLADGAVQEGRGG